MGLEEPLPESCPECGAADATLPDALAREPQQRGYPAVAAPQDGRETRRGETISGDRPPNFSTGRSDNGPEAWPEAWRSLFLRTAPAPIIWTYAELGDDLSGRGDKDRSACLRHIIGSLQLPKGSSSFWPVSLSGGETGEAVSGRERYFQEGLRLLKPGAVIFLGAGAVELSGIALNLHIPYTQTIARGMLHVLLPDFTTLLAGENFTRQACVFLRSSLGDLHLF